MKNCVGNYLNNEEKRWFKSITSCNPSRAEVTDIIYYTYTYMYIAKYYLFKYLLKTVFVPSILKTRQYKGNGYFKKM